MDIEFLIERLERYILVESPKFLGNRAVNDDEVRHQLTQIRESLPEELRKAREIMAERDALLAAAHEEADHILAAARAEVEELAGEHRLVQAAQHQARGIARKAEQEAAALRVDADEYVFDSLSQLQGELTRILHVVENGLQRLESDRERHLQAKGEAAEPGGV